MCDLVDNELLITMLPPGQGLSPIFFGTKQRSCDP